MYKKGLFFFRVCARANLQIGGFPAQVLLWVCFWGWLLESFLAEAECDDHYMERYVESS